MMVGNVVILLAREDGGWWLFEQPRAVLVARSAAAVPALLREAQAWTARGGYAAGYLAYEAAPAFDPAFAVRRSGSLPVAWFGLFEKRQALAQLPAPAASYAFGAWRPTMGPQAYARGFARIRDGLRSGDTYQVNYTFRLRTDFHGEPLACFLELYRRQPTAQAAFIGTEDFAIGSVSPELFFSLKDGVLESRPMKGTAPRGLWYAVDQKEAARLRRSPKCRAENTMIVDMVRNDMGRVAKPGTVHVSAPFTVQRYPTVWQMISTVRAHTTADWLAVLGALFPCASITGAPKVRTMQIIREVEATPRGVYTGAIGYAGHGYEARFNVAIRTVAIDRARGRATYGVGGGIVWDSGERQEYDECRAKAAVLSDARPPFDLLETMLWRPGRGFFLIAFHMQRLVRSAAFFLIPLDARAARKALRAAARGLPPRPHRVRLTVNQAGRVRIAAVPLAARKLKRPFRVALAAAPVDSGDPFLYHKTTHRAVYETARAARPSYDDVLLYNARGELTESTLANLVVVLGGRHITPDVAGGLLAGTYREWLLRRRRVTTGVLSITDLARAERIYLVNSVRGVIPCTLLSPQPCS